MNKIRAKKCVEDLLHHNFRYLYKETSLGLMDTHLTFKMDSNTHELQMTLKFEENYCDVLCFISPTVLTEDYYEETLKTVNAINAYVKSCGRFYIDDYMDIAYSLRTNYDVIDIMPEYFIKEIETAIQFYEDVFCILLDVSQGKKSFEESRDFIEKMWSRG